MELVSIIVPVYKVEDKVGRCLESLLKQTYQNIEIILVNDGTPDSSFEICKNYAKKDNRILLIDKKENTGRSDTRNLGIRKAKGKFILFVDSDDFVTKEYVEGLVELSQNGESWGICSYFRYNSNDVDNLYITNSEQKEKKYTKAELASIMQDCSFNSLWNKIYLKEILYEDNIIFNTKLSLGEDLNFNLKYWQKWVKDITISGRKLYYYNITGQTNIGYNCFDNTINMWKDFEEYLSNSRTLYSECEYCDMQSMILDDVINAIYHDFSLKKSSFGFRYLRARKELKHEMISRLLLNSKQNIIKRFLLKHRFVLLFKILRRFKN